ncbi:MAG: glycerol-3-phosphate acyltransferase, partial [Pseudomonadota bacterium]
VPVLPVPVVAHVLLAHGKPMTREALNTAVEALLAKVPHAHVHLPREDDAYLVEVGLRNLQKRGLVQDGPEGLQVVEAERDLVSFYARSIAHLLG